MLQAGIMRRQDGRRECAWSKRGSGKWWVVEAGMGSVYLNGLEVRDNGETVLHSPNQNQQGKRRKTIKKTPRAKTPG